jgi:hypothetical protein
MYISPWISWVIVRWIFSAFTFEFYMGALNCLLKNAVRPDAPICWRIAESRVTAAIVDNDDSVTVGASGENDEVIVLKVRGIRLPRLYPNNTCIADGMSYQIVGVSMGNGKPTVLVHRFR